MIATCDKCTALHSKTSGAPSICPRCASLAELLDCADSLVLWRLRVDLISSSQAGPELLAILDRIEAAATKARAS